MKLMQDVYSAIFDPAKGGGGICGWGKYKNKRTENIFFNFSLLLGEKKTKIICGSGDNLNKIRSS